MRVNLAKMERGVVLDLLEYRVFLERVVMRVLQGLVVLQVLQVKEENQEQLVQLAFRVCLELLDPLERMENLVKPDQKESLVLPEPQVAKVKMVSLVKEVCKVFLDLLVLEVLLVHRVPMVGRDLLGNLVQLVQWDHLVFKECQEKEVDLEILGLKGKGENLVAEV